MTGQIAGQSAIWRLRAAAACHHPRYQAGHGALLHTHHLHQLLQVGLHQALYHSLRGSGLHAQCCPRQV